MGVKEGKRFEQNFANSCRQQKIWYFKIKDINVQPKHRRFITIPKNEYDNFCFHKHHLFPMELKSTHLKSISFDEKIIKEHQIKNLTIANQYEGVIAGFLMNFRKPTNRAFFVHIDEFNKYKKTVEKGLDHNYKSKTNEKSIPLGICEEIGIELKSKVKRVNHFYFVEDLINEVVKKYGNNRVF